MHFGQEYHRLILQSPSVGPVGWHKVPVYPFTDGVHSDHLIKVGLSGFSIVKLPVFSPCNLSFVWRFFEMVYFISHQTQFIHFLLSVWIHFLFYSKGYNLLLLFILMFSLF